ncbi:M23 family metallopeptidase [Streptomyces spongiae]|uniref:Peptidoglycan DD-metalloendopeptidase family protein n=1 Tax=Streptomyces spongiae TaxID=565072 RepID=A0A5N8XD05_9ACTN|nr:M23 family metallopeptidase [Streptomyces spongiae]MPY57403.1 peptidoglycan DD-metalloendopeptidase family protein [Streptomyces spongiae]
MRSSRRRHPLLVPVLLCACAVLVAPPTAAEGDSGGTGLSGAPGYSARVVALYEEAAVATQQYELGRSEAEAQRAQAQRLEKLLVREREQIAVLHEDLGRIARARYREGGGLPYTVQLLLADSPEELMRGHRVVRQANLAVDKAVSRSRRAEARLAADEKQAVAEWRKLQRRNADLAETKRAIEKKLEDALWMLQGQADASAAAGACPGATRLGQPPTGTQRAWVAPVEGYVLSAGFGSGGARWANRHTGQDFAVPVGTPVRAVGAGQVVRVSCGGAFGLQIVIRHPDGYYTQYAHLASLAVDPGEQVATGQWIGQAGTTGNSTGPHLHFEVRITPELGSGIDPVPWLLKHGVDL